MDAGYDLPHDVSVFDGAVRLGNVFEPKFLDLERDSPRTYGGIQTVDRLARHLTVKRREALWPVKCGLGSTPLG